MSFCSGCGSELAEDAAFCSRCGKAVGAGATAPPAAATPTSPQAATSETGLEENVAALLCYVVGWLTGVIFFLIDKRPYVRFHAMQSIIAFGALHLLQIILLSGGIFGGMLGGRMGGYMFWGMASLTYSLFYILILITWVLCMVKAYQGQRFKLPVVGKIAEGYAK